MSKPRPVIIALSLEIKNMARNNPVSIVDRLSYAYKKGWGTFGDFVLALVLVLNEEREDSAWCNFVSTGLFWHLLNIASHEETWEMVIRDNTNEFHVLTVIIGNVMTCIHEFVGYLWSTAEAGDPGHNRVLDDDNSAPRIECSSRFVQFLPVVQRLFGQLSAVWRVFLRSEVKAPGQNFMNWAPEFSRRYGEIALLQSRLHRFYLKRHLSASDPACHVIMRYWLIFSGPAEDNWMLHCIMPILQSASRDDQKVFLAAYTATNARATCVVKALLAGIRDPELPFYLLTVYHGFLTYVAVEIPDSPSLREIITGYMAELIMATYSAIARNLCVEFFEQVVDVIKCGCDVILVLLRVLIRDHIDPFGLLSTAPMMALLCWIMANLQFRYHESLKSVSRIPGFYVDIALRTKSDSKERRDLVQLLQLYWPRCIQEVRRRRFDAETRRNWEDVGKRLKLKESVDSLQVRHRWQRTMPCHWNTCLCSQIKCKHPMYVCKGCWHVYYCSTKCQTIDWNEGGHKAVCEARRSL